MPGDLPVVVIGTSRSGRICRWWNKPCRPSRRRAESHKRSLAAPQAPVSNGWKLPMSHSHKHIVYVTFTVFSRCVLTVSYLCICPLTWKSSQPRISEILGEPQASLERLLRESIAPEGSKKEVEAISAEKIQKGGNTYYDTWSFMIVHDVLCVVYFFWPSWLWYVWYV